MRGNLKAKTGRILSAFGHVLGAVGDIMLFWDYKEGKLPGSPVNPCGESGDPHQCGT